MTRTYILLPVLLLWILVAGACGDGGGAAPVDGDIPDGDGSDGDSQDGDRDPDGDAPDGDITDGDITDGDVTDGDVTDGDSEEPLAWGDILFLEIAAPDERTVQARFDGKPDPEAAALAGTYSLNSALGDLDILGVDYDPETGTLVLQTSPQKLGVSYTLSVVTPENDGPAGDFLSADTRLFWVMDFSRGYVDTQVSTWRAAAGEYGVIYVQEGYALGDAQAMMRDFDENIYPTMTALYAAAPDIDENGRIVILALDGGGYYGGYFNPVNQYADSITSEWWGMRSNEMEIIHLNVLTEADYLGQINAHEFQHLLYHGHRGFTDPYWEYHDEGLAESAVAAVYGSNELATLFLQWDGDGLLGNGLSLVHWNYAEYANYALAYHFWTYVAAQMTGDHSAFGTIFRLATGHPDEVDAFLRTELGLGFPEVHQQMLAAFWVQHETGPYSFHGLVSTMAASYPRVPSQTESLDLEPFSGAFFKLAESSVSYPGTQGADIRYLGINAAGEVDDSEPFDISGGVLLVSNMSMDYIGWPRQASGPDLPALRAEPPRKRDPLCEAVRIPTWKNPPPYNPTQPSAWEAWAEGRLRDR